MSSRDRDWQPEYEQEPAWQDPRWDDARPDAQRWDAPRSAAHPGQPPSWQAPPPEYRRDDQSWRGAPAENAWQEPRNNWQEPRDNWQEPRNGWQEPRDPRQGWRQEHHPGQPDYGRDQGAWRQAPPQQPPHQPTTYQSSRPPVSWEDETRQLSGPGHTNAHRGGQTGWAQPPQQREYRPGAPYRSPPAEQYPAGHQQRPPQYAYPQQPAHHQPRSAPPGMPPPQQQAPPARKKRRGWKIVGSIVSALAVAITIAVVRSGVRETFDEDAHAPEVLLEYVMITDTPELTAEADRVADEMARYSGIARDRVALAYYRLKTDPAGSPPKLFVAEAVGKVDVKSVRDEFAKAATDEGLPAVQEYPAEVPDGKIRCTAGMVEQVQMSACQWASTSHYVEVYFITGKLEEHRALFVQIRAALAEK